MSSTSFVFSYVSICPAISIILSDKKLVNTNVNRKNLFDWLNNLFNLFNTILKTNIYIINESDLDDPHTFFKKIFNIPLWSHSNTVLKSPKLWGKYIWSLLHIISLFWTSNTSYNVYYLIKNASDILPCEKCKNDYIYIFKDPDLCKQLNFINSVEESVNFILILRKRITKTDYNLITTYNNHDFLDIYNYIKPLVEPKMDIKKMEYNNKTCSCKIKKKI